ncbi:hypothetical protein CC86DRAFT_180987 [Ophiobolus disseminans]|uniref:Uncharacterized protein n=1 Tax=Ophiobolus disseminans TaxID=1469910 RepID=A0A6A7ABU0_9PLEO|nr:hypothetical protein CC86DRAFT_180987 [Ophiobolus disseminans]
MRLHGVTMRDFSTAAGVCICSLHARFHSGKRHLSFFGNTVLPLHRPMMGLTQLSQIRVKLRYPYYCVPIGKAALREKHAQSNMRAMTALQCFIDRLNDSPRLIKPKSKSSQESDERTSTYRRLQRHRAFSRDIASPQRMVCRCSRVTQADVGFYRRSTGAYNTSTDTDADMKRVRLLGSDITPFSRPSSSTQTTFLTSTLYQRQYIIVQP